MGKNLRIKPSYTNLVDALVGMVVQHITDENGELTHPDVSADEAAIDALYNLDLIRDGKIVNEALDINWLRDHIKNNIP